MVIRSLSAPEPELLVLNNQFAVETSFLDAVAWGRMVAMARFALACGGEGFLLAFDETADYASPNFVWFRERYDRFCYIDRVVFAASAQGQGLGRALYERLFADAAAAGLARVVCEINLDPPNPGSLVFHHKAGFEPVGEQVLADGKRVGYFLKALPGHDPM